jgi:hypothetical protein
MILDSADIVVVDVVVGRWLIEGEGIAVGFTRSYTAARFPASGRVMSCQHDTREGVNAWIYCRGCVNPFG